MKRTRATRTALVLIITGLIMQSVGLTSASCAPAAKTAAEAIDEAEQQDCILNARTREEADSCRAQVRARFSAHDAGKD